MNTASPLADRSHENAPKSAQCAAKMPIHTPLIQNVVESPSGAFTMPFLADWKQNGAPSPAEMNAAAWVTVHDGHDFSAGALIRINGGESPAAGERGSVRLARRVPLAA